MERNQEAPPVRLQPGEATPDGQEGICLSFYPPANAFGSPAPQENPSGVQIQCGMSDGYQKYCNSGFEAIGETNQLLSIFSTEISFTN